MSARQWKNSEKTDFLNESGPLKEEYTPEIIPSITHFENSGRTLLLHPDKPVALVLNTTGKEIYRLCDGRHSIREISENIAAGYSQPYSRVYPDVLSFIEELKVKGFLLPSEKTRAQTDKLPGIQGIHINITNRCNLRCLHCSITDTQDINELRTGRIIRLIDELVNMGGKTVSITGGEPLLREDCLFIVQHAASRLRTTLLTNAAQITPETARRIADLGITVQVSLDGATPEIHDSIRGRGAYQKAIRGIELLKKSGIGDRLYLRFTLMKINFGDLKNILGLAGELGIGQVRLIPVEKLGRAKNNWEKLGLSPADYDSLFNKILESFKNKKKGQGLPRIKWGCSGLNLHLPADGMSCDIGQSITIDASGNIFPCTLLTHHDLCLGNINNMTLEDIAQSEALKNLYLTCLNRRSAVSKCSECVWRNFCQGGCPASVYADKGALSATDDLCKLRHKFYMEAFLGSTE